MQGKFTKHLATGADIPVLVQGDKFVEDMKDRKGFKIDMLQMRWKLPRENVANILQKYKVPAYLVQPKDNPIADHIEALDKAIFWSEYVFAIEQKTNMPHTKLKARTLEQLVRYEC